MKIDRQVIKLIVSQLRRLNEWEAKFILSVQNCDNFSLKQIRVISKIERKLKIPESSAVKPLYLRRINQMLNSQFVIKKVSKDDLKFISELQRLFLVRPNTLLWETQRERIERIWRNCGLQDSPGNPVTASLIID